MSELIDFVFVHGGGQGGWAWDETLAAMRAQDDGKLGQLLAIDAPGCGSKRGVATDDISMADVTADLLADVDRAGITRAILVGHSQGGQPLPFMARQRPDLFSRVIYVSCTAPLPGQNVQQMMGTGLHGANPEEIGWPVDPVATETNYRAALLYCNDMLPAQKAGFMAKLGHDMWPMATYVESGWSYDKFGGVPASYVVCLQDQSLPVSWQLKFAERLQAERLVHIDAGHQVMNSRPHALAEALRIEALADLTRQSGEMAVA
jgi:pimeloyl-ACP methyl ester carboxylesterase